MTFNIFGIKIKVIFSENLPADWLGLYDPVSKKIAIHKELNGDAKTQVILHEFLHATFDRLAFGQTKVGIGVEEMLCDSIATALVENFEIKPRR